jgi:hypothetical protein
VLAAEVAGGDLVPGGAAVVSTGLVAGGRLGDGRVEAGCVVGEGMVISAGFVCAAVSPGTEQHHDDHHHEGDHGPYSNGDPRAGAAFPRTVVVRPGGAVPEPFNLR